MPRINRKTPDKTHTQSILFDKKKFTLEQAKKWIKERAKKKGYILSGLDENSSGKYYRFRQYNPILNSDKFRYRQKRIEDGIIFIIGFKK